MMKKKNDSPSELSAALKNDVPYITIAGDSELTVENHRGIITYDDVGVKINTHDKIIKISGEALTLAHITDETVSVVGKITGVEFI